MIPTVARVDPFGSNLSSQPAICLEGGGARGFTTGFAALAELERHGLLSRFGAISSVSGGTWANVLFCYGNEHGDRGQFLGTSGGNGYCDISDPGSITQDNVGHLDDKCARVCSAGDTGDASYLQSFLENFGDVVQAWTAALEKFYLKPFGIDDTRDLAHRNTSPLPLFCATFASPQGYSGEPTVYEMWPSCVGTFVKRNAQYQADFAPSLSLPLGYYTDTASAWAPLSHVDDAHACVKTPFGLTDIAVASSYAPGAVTDTLPDVDSAQLTRPLLYRENGSLRELPSAVLADGGVVDNLGIIPLVQRGVRTILCLANEGASLKFEPPPNPDPYCNVDYTILALFGRPIPSDASFGQYLRYENAHIFEEDDISIMVNAMKESLDTDDGILCSFQVRTVRNDFYQIQAGTQHTIVLFYPSVPKNWHDSLTDDYVRGIVAGKDLPFVATGVANVSKEESNLIASMVAWTMERRLDVITSALGP